MTHPSTVDTHYYVPNLCDSDIEANLLSFLNLSRKLKYYCKNIFLTEATNR